jgi:thioredoxin 1
MTIVVYGASWCGPCKLVKETLSKSGLSYKLIDIEQHPNKAAEAGVRGVPTTIIYNDDNKEVKRIVGSSADLLSKLQEIISV